MKIIRTITREGMINSQKNNTDKNVLANVHWTGKKIDYNFNGKGLMKIGTKFCAKSK